MKKKILVLDDEELILESIGMIFADLGFDVSVSQDSAKGVAMAKEEAFDLILTDIRMPGLNGAQAVQAIRAARPLAKILVVTAYPGDRVVQQALESGAIGVMKKPFEVAKILEYLKGD